MAKVVFAPRILHDLVVTKTGSKIVIYVDGKRVN